MADTIQFEADNRSPAEKFSGYLHAVSKDARSFASCVRVHHLAIEEAIRNGTPLEAIAHGLSQAYGVRGSLAALKSALNRIRRMREAEIDRQWYDQVDQEQYGASVFQMTPRGNPHPVSGGMPPQGGPAARPYAIPMTQHLPGAPTSMPGGGLRYAAQYQPGLYECGQGHHLY